MNDDLALIKEVKVGSDAADQALRELIHRHSGIYLDIVNNYIPTNCNFIRRSDVLQEKDYYIYQAALKYRDDKGTKFSTYLGNETKWMCMNLFNKNKKFPLLTIDEGGVLDQEHSPPPSFNMAEFEKVIELTRAHPDKRVEVIFRLRYIEGENNKLMPWQKISTELDMSIQGCINIHNAALKTFKSKREREMQC